MTPRRASFTLTEMLVALAVTVLVLAMVTSVFSVTTKTASTSAAIADVESLARNFADQLTQDLDDCDPSQSVLIIHGRTIPAALTADQLAARQYYRVLTGDPGLVSASYQAQDYKYDTTSFTPNDGSPRAQYSDPRADILMFFTDRPSASQAPATATNLTLGTYQEKLQRGTKVSPIQVVYGHAALDTAVPTGSVSSPWAFANNPQHIEQTSGSPPMSVLPADRWHLARRALLLEPPLGAQQLPTVDDWNRWTRCYDPRSPTPVAADSMSLDFPRYLAYFEPWVNNGALVGVARRSPYLFPDTFSGSPSDPVLGTGSWLWNANSDAANEARRWLYYNWRGDETYHHVATVIENPPAALQSNLGVHLLPGCVWFQVEILIPEDPRNGLESPLSDQRRDTPRWVEVENGQTYVFVPDTAENRELVAAQATATTANPLYVSAINGRVATFKKLTPGQTDVPGISYNGLDTLANRRIRMWPYAIRVTVRVVDQRGRLAEPIVRSVVHRFE